MTRYYCRNTPWVQDALDHVPIEEANEEFLGWDTGDIELYGWNECELPGWRKLKKLSESEFVEKIKKHFPPKGEALPELPVTTDLNQELLERLERETEVRWWGGNEKPTEWSDSEVVSFLQAGEDGIGRWVLSTDLNNPRVTNDEFVEIVKSKLPKAKPKLKLEDVYTLWSGYLVRQLKQTCRVAMSEFVETGEDCLNNSCVSVYLKASEILWGTAFEDWPGPGTKISNDEFLELVKERFPMEDQGWAASIHTIGAWTHNSHSNGHWYEVHFSRPGDIVGFPKHTPNPLLLLL